MSTASRRWRRWVRWAFLAWAVFSTAWLVDTFRTRDVDEALLQSSGAVQVVDSETSLAFVPKAVGTASGLVFLPGGGVAPEAYAPMLRPLAEAGYPVVIVRLPWRLAPLDSHKRTAMQRALDAAKGSVRWVLAGHSLGGALASRLVAMRPERFEELVLLGTTHPKRDDLSGVAMPVTKAYGALDGVAPVEKIEANRHLLPPHTRFVEIPGGNHSLFGHYGHQLFDGRATIPRAHQQAVARSVLDGALERAAGSGR